MWRLVFFWYKLDATQRKHLQNILDEHDYSCGASLFDLNLPEIYKDVDIQDHSCHDPIEVLYYTAKYAPICIYCAEDEPYGRENEYPKFRSCSDKPSIYVKTKK